MSRLANLFLALGISAVLILGAAGIYSQILKGRAGIATGAQMVEAIRASEQLAAKWSAEVGRVKNQPDADFDSLAGYIPRLAAQREVIVTAHERVGELPDEIKNGIRGYVSRVQAKQELIERFKMDYAVVRNSQDFLLNDPEGGKALLKSAREGRRIVVEDAARLMFDEMEQFIRTPDRMWQQRTRQTLDALLEASSCTREAAKAKEIAAHVEILLERHELAEDRFEEASSSREISNAADALTTQLDAHHQANQLYVDYLDYALYAVVGITLIYWTSLVLRAFRGRGRREAEAPVPAEVPAAAAAIGYVGALRARQPESGADAGRPDAGAPAEEVIVLAAPAPVMAAETAEIVPRRERPLQGAAPAPVAAADTAEIEGDLEPIAPARAGTEEAGIGLEPAAPVAQTPAPAPAPVREGGFGLATHAMVEAVFGRLAEVATELDRAAEAGEVLRSPEAERPEQALAALLGRLAGARWSTHRLAAQARDMLEGEVAEPDLRRTDLRDALTWLLDALDATHRERITAVLLPGTVADIDRRAFEAAMERVLIHALEAAARHPGGTGYVELTLTTHEGRHCISCVDYGPGPLTGVAAPAGDAPPSPPYDTLNLDIARRLVIAQGGEFEATTYPPYGSRIRILLHPATKPLRLGRDRSEAPRTGQDPTG